MIERLRELRNFYSFTLRQEQRIEDLIKDISIGFANYVKFRSIELDINAEELFNEYLNTLK